MAKDKCEKEVKKAIEHALDLVDEKHRKALGALYQQWEIERGKHAEEVGILKTELVNRNNLIRGMAKYIGRGV